MVHMALYDLNFSLSFCGYSNSSVDSAISTSHSQSELSSPKNEFRLSFIYLKAMATLDSTRLCEGLDNTIDDNLHKNQEGESAFYEESLNLSEYSSGTSTFDSGKWAFLGFIGICGSLGLIDDRCPNQRSFIN